MPVHFDYQQASESERLRSVMPGCPVGDLFGHQEWQQQLLAWEQEETLMRELHEIQVAREVGKRLTGLYGVSQQPPELPTTYVAFRQPVDS
jgi:hypothetical protein